MDRQKPSNRLREAGGLSRETASAARPTGWGRYTAPWPGGCMSERIAKKPTLFTVPADPDAPPRLCGGRCRCGRLLFPAQRFGCDACGAAGDAIRPADFDAEGVLTAFATSHRQRRPGSESPLVVGTIALDAGPVVESALAVEDASGLRIGARMRPRLLDVSVDDDGRRVVDCFFEPAEGA